MESKRPKRFAVTRDFFVLAASCASVLLLSVGCRPKSVMPSGFEGLELGMPLDQALTTVFGNPGLKDRVYLRAGGCDSQRSKTPLRSKEDVRAVLALFYADIDRRIEALGGVPSHPGGPKGKPVTLLTDPDALAALACPCKQACLELQRAGDFDEVLLDFSLAPDERLTTTRFILKNTAVPLYDSIIAKTQMKLGGMCKDERPGDGRTCPERKQCRWERCDQGFTYEVGRAVCVDGSGGTTLSIGNLDCPRPSLL